ncbi:MAG TPA: hypothetical protein VK903_01515 [Propionicimonas sp.]|nr:hypothetical protein [Propionicimonas sp.]
MSHLGATRRRSLNGLIAVVLALSMTMFGAAVSTASATHKNPHRLHDTAKNVKVKSFIYGKTASGKNVRGVFIPRQFKTVGDRLYAQGRLKGKIVRPGKDRHFVKRGVMLPVQSVNGQSAVPSAARVCPVLNLVLGPLDLDLLGLVVHLDRVVLRIVAQSGAGQLLGNLLCGVAGLLDGGPLAGLLSQLQSLLNRILGIVGPLRA